jgi:uncharacterized peroxidase-related enzyme
MMAFISTIPATEAKNDVLKMYERAEAAMGYVPNYAKVFSHRPNVMSAWADLVTSIRSNLDLRRYELTTLAAAQGLRCTYCMIAHSSVLLKHDFHSSQVEAIARDFTTADLQPAEVAIMSFAEKIARDASSVTADDIQQLRDHGLTDAEVFDVAATAAARCFFSKLLDALGAQADSVYLDLDEDLRESLTVGRIISTDPVERV